MSKEKLLCVNFFKLIFVLALLFISSIGFSQVPEIKGNIVEEETNNPIAYVNISVLNKNVGTISKRDGSFVLNPKSAKETDSIVFSYVGFKTQSFTLKSLKSFLATNNNIILEENIEALNEIVLMSKKDWKRKVLGSETTSELGYGFSSHVGSEIGRKIKIKKENTHLLKFSTHVSKNTYDTVKLRLNIYTIKENLPAEKINTKNIYLDFDKTSGFIEVDLEPYNMVVSEDIIVTLEAVEYVGKGDFEFSSKLPGFTKLILKQYGEVLTFPITLGFNISVKY